MERNREGGSPDINMCIALRYETAEWLSRRQNGLNLWFLRSRIPYAFFNFHSFFNLDPPQVLARLF